MSEDTERDTDNPGPFESPTELGSVCTSLALEEVARLRDAEREAYRRGAEKFAADVHAEARKIAGRRNAEYRDFGAALLTVEYFLVRGEWPKGGADANVH